MFTRRNFFSGTAATAAAASEELRASEAPFLTADPLLKEARRAARRGLGFEAKNFVEFANGEDVWLMKEILLRWSSMQTPRGDEPCLANAFQPLFP